MKRSKLSLLSSLFLMLALIFVLFESCYDYYDVEEKTSSDEESSDIQVLDTSASGNTNDTSADQNGEKNTSYGNFSTTEKTIPSADREKQIQESELSYSVGSSYSKEEIIKVANVANRIKNLGSIVYQNAASMMDHYLGGSGDTYVIDMKSFLSDETALKNRNEDINCALRAAENLASEGEKINIYQVEESIYHNLTGDWKYSVGSYFSSVELYDVTVSNGVYMAKLKYVVNDFYNWDWMDSENVFSGFAAAIVGDVSPKDLHQLHLNGAAKEFLSHGEITYRVTWVKGQDIKNIKLN